MTPAHSRLPLRCLLVFTAFVFAAHAPSSAVAQSVGARAATGLRVSPWPFGGTPTFPPACQSNIALGQANALSTRTCTGGATTPFAYVELFAQADAPQITGDLPALHASAKIHVDTSGLPPFNHAETLTADAGAVFTDYIAIGSPHPASMVVDFELTGLLNGHDPVGPPSNTRSLAFGEISITAQSGAYQAPFFGSFQPYGFGFGSQRTSWDAGVVADSAFYAPNNSLDYSLTNNGGGSYTLVLGPAFFANPDNTHLYLQIQLATEAQATSAWLNGHPAIDAIADFSHTLRMTSLRAYDENDVDVTDTAVVGFASDALPVPEPEWACGLLVGTAALATMRRGARGAHAANTRTPIASITARSGSGRPTTKPCIDPV